MRIVLWELLIYDILLLQIRITKTMIVALLDVQKSLATQYGAVVCLHKLGIAVVDAILLDNVSTYGYVSMYSVHYEL